MTKTVKAALIAGVLAIAPLAMIAPASADFVGVHVGPLRVGAHVGPHHRHYICRGWGYHRHCWWGY